jgi:hypothetical protein
VPTILKSNSDGLYFSYSIDSVSIFNVACINNLDSDLNLKIRLIIPPVRDYLIIHQMMYAPNSPYGEIYLAGETNFNSSSTTYMYVARIDSSLNVLPPPIEVRQISNIIPKHFELVGNYPNPFNPNTRIVFDVPKSADVRITVFDVLGREVATLINKKLAPGKYEVDFNGTNLPSGIYFYRLTSANYSQTKKMALVK